MGVPSLHGRGNGQKKCLVPTGGLCLLKSRTWQGQGRAVLKSVCFQVKEQGHCSGSTSGFSFSALMFALTEVVLQVCL